MERYQRICLFLGIVLLTAGCSDDLRFINVAPTVTSIGPIVPHDDQTMRVFLTIQDFESDPVDISVTASDPDGNEVETNVVPGEGHGVVGLTSSPDLPGTLHEVVIEVNPQDGPLSITVTPDDYEGGPGRPIVTPEFVFSEGLTEPFIP